MTPHEVDLIIERGRQARDLISSEAFVDTVNDLSSLYMAQMVSCPPDDASLPALRHANLMHYALAEIVSDLTGRSQAGSQAEEQRDNHEHNSENNSEDDSL